MKRRGRPPGGVYVNTYDPKSLVAFVSRVAILATHPTYSDFASRGGWKGVGGLESELDRADRVLIERVQELVNRTPARGGVPMQPDRFYLLAFYDSVSHDRGTSRGTRRSSDSDLRSMEHTEGGLPAHYFLELCNAGPARSKPEAIVRGLAMRAFLREASENLVDVLDGPRYASEAPLPSLAGGSAREAVGQTIRDLCVVAGHPPASGGMEATRLLAEAGTLAIDAVRQQVISGSPMSWRLLRVVTECLRRRESWGRPQDVRDPRHPESVVAAAADLLSDVHATNPPCIYRARSLWEEAVGHLPKTNMDGLDKFTVMLRQRALVGTTGNTTHESPLPIRERVTAAWVFVWRVARVQGWRPFDFESLRDALGAETRRILTEFANELLGPEQHPQMKGQERDRGLRYAGEFIHTVLNDQIFWYPYQKNEAFADARKASDWWRGTPESVMVEASIARVLRDDSERANLEPEGLLEPALGALVAQACLTIDGVSRRESLVTLEYSGLGDIASAIFSRVIDEARDMDPAEYRWLIENATFGLGWMASPRRSLERLLSLAMDPELDQSIRMTALMAVGDMADELRAHDRLRSAAGRAAVSIIESVPSTFTAPATGEATIFEFKLLVRSAVYVLAMLRDPSHLELLRQLAVSPRFEEPTTPALAQWGVDRIGTRQAVDRAWVELIGSDADHQRASADPSTLRRLVDPMESLEVVRGRLQSQPRSVQSNRRAKRKAT